MIKAVIFDFAGVISTEGYWLWLADNIPNLEATKDFFLNLSHKADKAEISVQEFTSILAEKSGIAQKDIWPEIFQKFIINKNILQLITKLKKNNYKIGLLTNFVSEWILEILNTYKLYVYFDQIIISSKYKITKPEPEIFHKMLDALDVNPQEAIFIDDRQLNIDGAEKVGIKGILYTTEENLLQNLQKEDIKYL